MATHEPIKELLELESRFLAAWNAGDTKAVVAFYAEDGVRVGAFGDIARGREELVAAYERLFHSGPMQGAKAEVTPSARRISEEIVLIEGPLKITPSNGTSPIEGYVLDIWKKTHDGWRIVESHPKFYPARK